MAVLGFVFFFFFWLMNIVFTLSGLEEEFCILCT